ncbi:MAG: DnaJ domain-containing protein [Bacteroidota bacterium]
MLNDYYSILETTYPSNQLEIKKQYRLLAKKWHPDINSALDATIKMQIITEAYYVLSNNRAKQLYDDEYLKKYGSKSDFGSRENTNRNNYDKNTDSNIINDELIDWINKAKIKSNEFVTQVINTTKGASLLGIKTAGKAFLKIIL